jgi:hypothetical protein
VFAPTTPASLLQTTSGTSFISTRSTSATAAKARTKKIKIFKWGRNGETADEIPVIKTPLFHVFF